MTETFVLTLYFLVAVVVWWAGTRVMLDRLVFPNPLRWLDRFTFTGQLPSGKRAIGAPRILTRHELEQERHIEWTRAFLKAESEADKKEAHTG